MNNILANLHQDHVNHAKLLDLLEGENKLLEKGERPSFIKMSLIMKYMNNYPDIFHHPFEEIMFEYLGDVDTEKLTIIENLCLEHSKLAKLGEYLQDAFAAALRGHIVPTEQITDRVREYINLLQTHIDTEENEIFPYILNKMTGNDWQILEDKFKHVIDPVFGDEESEEYKHLVDSLLN